MVDDIRELLSKHEPVAVDPAHEKRDQAAVLVPIVERVEPLIVFTERAGALSSHGGEVSFPGGKADTTDESLIHTALRENEEELGVEQDAVEIIGSLRPFVSKYGLLVTPYVGLLPGQTIYRPNPEEIASVFEVPVSYFGAASPVRVDNIERHGERHRVRVYDFEGYEIWGLTAMILREFLDATGR